MKYAMLVYSDQSTWDGISEEEAARRRAESMPRWIALFEEMGKADPRRRRAASSSRAAEAKVVRVVDGETVVTDGPFAETKEQLGGIFVTSFPTSTRRSGSRRSSPLRSTAPSRSGLLTVR